MSYGLRAAALPLAFLLAACSPDAARISAAEEAVRAKLRDPQSAIFTEVHAFSEGVVCGTVNSKNAYGALAGPEPFLSGARFDSDLDLGRDVKARDYALFCSNTPSKLLAYKKRELIQARLMCEDVEQYEYGCKREEELQQDIAATSAPASGALPYATSAPATAAASGVASGLSSHTRVFDQFDLGGAFEAPKCPAMLSAGDHSKPCIQSEIPAYHSLTVRPATPLPDAFDQIETFDLSFTSQAPPTLLRAFALVKPRDRAQVTAMVNALEKRFGPPQLEMSDDTFRRAEWDLPNAFIDLACPSNGCMFTLETAQEHKAVVAEIMARRTTKRARSDTP